MIGRDNPYRLRNKACRIRNVIAALRTPCFLILAFFLSTTATFAKPPVGLQFEPLSIRGRSGGPIALRIKLDYSQSLLLEGNLFLRIYHGTPNSNRRPTEDDLICTLRYDGIVLQGTDYFFRTVLPPIEHASSEQYEIEAWFETDSQRIPLSSDIKQLDPPEPHDVLSVAKFERATVLCSCSGELDFLELSPTRRFLNDGLSLDNYNPLSASDNTSDGGGNVGRRSRRINHYAAPWDARELPEDPLALCCFDVVLLADGALGILQPPQMAALKTWIEAGGSLCVLPNDNRMDGRHLEFLQQLFEADNDPDFALSLTDEGGLLVISDEAAPMILRHVGLGRVALLPDVEDLAARFLEPDLGRLVAHLWKVQHASPVKDGKPWRMSDPFSAMTAVGMEIRTVGDYYAVADIGSPQDSFISDFYERKTTTPSEIAATFGLSDEMFPTSNRLIDACEEVLMPSGVEMVPTWVIAAILAAYVVTIGPVDYIVLGFFRLRKLTWILFPVVTAGYTLLTVYVANAYMASTETGGRLVITDVIDDGRPVRESIVQLHFYGGQQTLATPAITQFLVPTAAVNETRVTDPRIQQMAEDQWVGRQPSVLNYSGRLPQSYTVEQTVQQWSPKTTRSFTLTPATDTIPQIPWNDASLLTTEKGRKQLADLLKDMRWDRGTFLGAVVMHETKRSAVRGRRNPFDSDALDNADLRLMVRNQYSYYQPEDVSPEALLATGLIHATESQPVNFFGIVSQIAPNGSGTLEDLPILDPSDPNQWALVVVMRTDEGYHAFRKLYVVGDGSDSVEHE